MSTRTLLTRLGKLETVFDTAGEFSRYFINELTHDEQQVYLLLNYRAFLQDPNTPADNYKTFSEMVESIEAAIREMTRREKSPEDARHFEECRGWWKKRGHTEEYVPALTMWHFNFDNTLDWNKPNLMQRRLALRAMPEVQALRVSVN